jgi:hypothetical protein
VTDLLVFAHKDDGHFVNLSANGGVQVANVPLEVCGALFGRAKQARAGQEATPFPVGAITDFLSMI